MKIHNKKPNLDKYYLVRTGNSLSKIKEWLNWAKKNNESKQHFIIINNHKELLRRGKEHKDYWKFRIKGGHEDKYHVYASI